MKKIWICAMVALLVLGGCTPGGDPVPSGTPSEPLAETVVPSPTPTWTGEQQAVIDAVHRFYDEWSRITQNLDTADWNDLHQVADDTAISNTFAVWADWLSRGWHLSGSPEITPTSVMESMSDHRGKQYVVRGCFSMERSTLVDSSGQPVGERGMERSVGVYRVLHRTNGAYVVIEAGERAESC